MTRRWPGLSAAALRDAVGLQDRGRRHAVFARDGLDGFAVPTVTGEPPSQVQCPAGAARARGTEPVTSDARRADRRPSPARRWRRRRRRRRCAGRLGAGSGCASTRPLDAGRDAIEPVASLRRRACALGREGIGVEALRCRSCSRPRRPTIDAQRRQGANQRTRADGHVDATHVVTHSYATERAVELTAARVNKALRM